MKGTLKIFIGLYCLLLLAACGGGGKDSPTYLVGGSTSGLTGALVLQNNGGNDLQISASGAFSFPNRVSAGATYNVTVRTQPARQFCTAENGNGAVGSADVSSIKISCVDIFLVGGTISGLKGTLILQNPDSPDLSITSDGSFNFSNLVPAGTDYNVSVKTQPFDQTCTVVNGTGTLAAADVSQIAISCVVLPLRLVDVEPKNDAIDVKRQGSFILTFSAPLDAATVTTAGVSLVGVAGPQPISLNVSGTQLTVIPTISLSPLTSYSLTANATVLGSIGQRLAMPIVVNVTTEDRSWQTSVPVRQNLVATHQALEPTVTFDSNGNALALWMQHDGTRYNIWSNWYRPVSGWSIASQAEASNLGAAGAQAVFDPLGNVTAVWRQGISTTGKLTGIWSSGYVAGSGWTNATAIENNSDPSGTSGPRLAGDANGNAVAVWFQADGTRDNIWANSFDKNTGWGTSTLLESDTGEAAWPDIAMNSSGKAIVAWYQYANGGLVYSSIWTRRFSRENGWESGLQIPNYYSTSTGPPQIGMDATGNALAVWAQNDTMFGRAKIFTSRSAAGGFWSTPTILGTDSTVHLDNPQIAVNAKGDAVAAWLRLDGLQSTLWASYYTTTGNWRTAIQIPTTIGSGASNQQVVIDSEGKALVIWQQLDSGKFTIWASRYVESRGWSAPVKIGSGVDHATHPQIAIDSSGKALAIWEQIDEDYRRNIWASRFE